MSETILKFYNGRVQARIKNSLIRKISNDDGTNQSTSIKIHGSGSSQNMLATNKVFLEAK